MANTVTSRAITVAIAFAVFGGQCGCADVQVRWSFLHVLDDSAGCAQGLERNAQLETVRDAMIYQELLAARPEAELIVAQLWQQSNDWRTVATRVREDKSLRDPVRRVALNMVAEGSVRSVSETFSRPR